MQSALIARHNDCRRLFDQVPELVSGQPSCLRTVPSAMPSDRAASFGVRPTTKHNIAHARRLAGIRPALSRGELETASPAVSLRAARSGSRGSRASSGAGQSEGRPIDVAGRVGPEADPPPVPERAGKGLLGDVLGRWPVQPADLECAHKTRIMHLVDGDEVVGYVAAAISCDDDSLSHLGAPGRQQPYPFAVLPAPDVL